MRAGFLVILEPKSFNKEHKMASRILTHCQCLYFQLLDFQSSVIWLFKFYFRHTLANLGNLVIQVILGNLIWGFLGIRKCISWFCSVQCELIKLCKCF